jgi:putative flippase GtrA
MRVPRALQLRGRRLPIDPSLVRFVLVGGVGFVVDSGIMLWLMRLHTWEPIAARSVSFPVAVALTWMLNRLWSFAAGRARKPMAQLAAYLLTQAGGLAINYLVFAGLTTFGGFWRDWPVICLAVGAVLSMAFTYTVSRRHVFSARPTASSRGAPPA